MPTNETNTGMSWVWVLFVILVLYLILCRGGTGLFGNCTNDNNTCNRVSNCEIEKREIVDSARNQFLVGQEGAATRAAIRDSQDAIMAQNNRIYEQRLQEENFDLKLENSGLKNSIFVKEQTDGIAKALAECCCGFNRRLDNIEYNMPKRPPFYPSGNIPQWGNSCC